MAQTPFRITPSLGPDLHQVEGQFYWDMVSDPQAVAGPSYPLGTRVVGNDGRDYLLVRAADDSLEEESAGTALDVDFGDFTAVEADSSGDGWETPVDNIPEGAVFHARRSEV